MVDDARGHVTSPPADDGHPCVLFLDNSSTFGGAIESLAHLVDGLAHRGFACVVVSAQPEDTLVRVFGDSAEIRWVDVPVRWQWRHKTMLYRLLAQMRSGSVLSRCVSALAACDWHLRRTLPSALRYARIGRRHRVDLVHLNNALESQLEGLLAAKLLGVPCVAHARGFERPTRALALGAPRVDRHIAISEAIRENLLTIGAPEERISVVHDGMDVETLAEPHDTRSVRDELGIPPGAPVFGLFGRIIEWKGVREFLLAAERVLERFDSAYALVVGDESDGSPDYFRQVRSLAEESDVADRILFTGYREDVPALMQALNVMVHCSIEPEPFGMVIAEAMAAGKPVVAADRGGPLDIVVEGETGFLVDPRDTDSLASAIERLLDDPELGEKMGAAGRRRAKRLFGKDRYAREIAEIYDEVVR